MSWFREVAEILVLGFALIGVVSTVVAVTSRTARASIREFSHLIQPAACGVPRDGFFFKKTYCGLCGGEDVFLTSPRQIRLFGHRCERDLI